MSVPESESSSPAADDGNETALQAVDISLAEGDGVAEMSSLMHLQEHQHQGQLSTGQNLPPSSALNLRLPASTSSSLLALAQYEASLPGSGSGSVASEWATPLPASQRSSLDSVETNSNLEPEDEDCVALDTLAQSSLERLQHASVVAPAHGTDLVQPEAVVLPPSPTSSTAVQGTQADRVLRRPRKRRQKESYMDTVSELTLCGMPHLKPLRCNFRNENAGAVFLLDFSASTKLPEYRTIKNHNQEWKLKASKLLKVLKKPPAKTTSRLIVIEDLSHDIFEKMGPALEVDPEAFAAQLKSSNHSRKLPRYDQEPIWHTSGMVKQHATVQWYRPVRLKADAGRWLKDQSSLQSLLGKGLSWSQDAVHYWKRDVTSRRRSRCLSLKNIQHNVQPTTNIFRKSWPLSPEPTDDAFEIVYTFLGKSTTKETSAWEERATLFKAEDAPVPTGEFCTGKTILTPVLLTWSTVILLVDPLPGLTDSQEVTQTRLRATPVPIQISKEPTVNKVDVGTFHPFRARVPIKLPPNKLHVTETMVEELNEALEPTSTSEALRSWISSPHGQTDPVIALLELVLFDCTAFFDSLDICLKRISKDSMDDYLMTKKLVNWRQLLNDFDAKIIEMSQSLHGFVDFVFDDLTSRPNRVDEIVCQLDAHTQKFTQRIEKTYAALRAEMGLFESRRSIAEAETVTRLTELAFFFIPLTFCCGLFSMQVNELQSGVPLRAFVVTAFVVFLICYGARMALRSTVIVESMSHARESLWRTGKMKPGSQIQIRKMIWLTLKEIWKRGDRIVTSLLFLAVLSFTVVPIAFMWSNAPLDAGLNAIVTLLLLPMGIALAWACIRALAAMRSRWSGDDFRNRTKTTLPLELKVALWVSKLLSRRKKGSRSGSRSGFSEYSESDAAEA